jgi:hypothetical protein
MKAKFSGCNTKLKVEKLPALSFRGGGGVTGHPLAVALTSD